MPSATSRAIDPVGITSTGARSSLPSRMTEPFPNCRSIWARADSRAFSRFSGDGMACSLCSRSVACRLSRSVSRTDGDAATRRVVSFDVVHARGGLRHPSSLLPSLWTDTSSTPAVQEPTRESNRCSSDTPATCRVLGGRRARCTGVGSGLSRARLEAPDAVAALGGHRSRRTARARPHAAGRRHPAPRAAVRPPRRTARDR